MNYLNFFERFPHDYTIYILLSASRLHLTVMKKLIIHYLIKLNVEWPRFSCSELSKYVNRVAILPMFLQFLAPKSQPVEVQFCLKKGFNLFINILGNF